MHTTPSGQTIVSELSRELASEVISAEEAGKLLNFRKTCKGYLKDFDGMIRAKAATNEDPAISTSIGREYACTVADALRIQGYCVHLGTALPNDSIALFIAW